MSTDWEKVKVDYENNIPVNELARKYGVKANTIKGRKQREKWKRNEPMSSAPNTKTIEDYIYADGYSIETIKDALYGKEDVIENFEQDALDEATSFYEKNISIVVSESDVENLANSYKDDALRLEKAERLKRHILANRTALALGAVRKVTVKYNAQGSIINTSVTNIIPTVEDERMVIAELDNVIESLTPPH